MLGIDPGLVATGYAVLESTAGRLGVLAVGEVEAPSRLVLEARLRLIYDGIATLLDKHDPAALVLEDLYAEYRFPRTALLMAHARGVVCLAAWQRGVPVMALAPAEVKRSVTGNGAAGKEQVQRSVQRLLALAEPPRSTHVGDALALAFTGLGRMGARR
ncbi:MAG TPA: crossover junction endodeoxyribonuclease RuvC [Methylomirabilota bacterium]